MYLAYYKTDNNYMYEKYDATILGEGGDGGEYVPQTGFGWTNGLALYLLQEYKSTPPSYTLGSIVFASLITLSIVVGILILVFLCKCYK
jgi:hypothetical protein